MPSLLFSPDTASKTANFGSHDKVREKYCNHNLIKSRCWFAYNTFCVFLAAFSLIVSVVIFMFWIYISFNLTLHVLMGKY